MKIQDVKKAVRDGYAEVAKNSSCCCGVVSSSCGDNYAKDSSKELGYTEEQLSQMPDEANMGLGCGIPIAHADIKPGETVIDLGAGGGIDCFIAAKAVGEAGRVIGVDMTPEMIDKARANAENGHYGNVEFRLGEIEHLPVADNSADLITSNCVINLAPDKGQVYREAYRVLQPGGRFVVSDIVTTEPLPEWILESVKAYTGCISGAIMRDDYLEIIKAAGFTDVVVLEEKFFPIECMQNDPTAQKFIRKTGMTMDGLNDALKGIVSITVRGWKK
ncbi:arsenite methyltransferase [bacterium]|nr:arsenite methyltransferase [bacterium]MBU1652040.1 arsenite methyltransferase [bacterium]MBU1882187.1 arsenite methyltransferase [bacterium]